MWILNELFWNMWRAMKRRREEGSLAFLASVCSGWPVVAVAGGCYGLNMQSWCHSPTWVALDSGVLWHALSLFWSLWRNPHSQTAVISEEFKCLFLFLPQCAPRQGKNTSSQLRGGHHAGHLLGIELLSWPGLRQCCSSICNLFPATVSPWPSWGSTTTPQFYLCSIKLDGKTRLMPGGEVYEI